MAFPDYNQLAHDLQDAEVALSVAKANVKTATATEKDAAKVEVTRALKARDKAKAQWDAAKPGERRSTFLQRLTENNMVGSASFLVLIVIIVVACIFHAGVRQFLHSLADTDSARGVITAIVVGTTALLAVILIFAAISTDSTDNEKSFNRGKEVFTVLVGICGTCVGFYFSQPASSRTGLTVTGPQVTYDEHTAKISAEVTGGRAPWFYQITWDVPNIENVKSTQVLDGRIIDSVKIPESAPDKITGRLVLRDSSTLTQSVEVTLQKSMLKRGPGGPQAGNTSPGNGTQAPPLKVTDVIAVPVNENKQLRISGSITGGTEYYDVTVEGEGVERKTDRKNDISSPGFSMEVNLSGPVPLKGKVTVKDKSGQSATEPLKFKQ